MNRRGPGIRKVDIDLQYQQLIPGPPASAGDLYKQACSGDKITVDSWRKIWLDQFKAAKERFGNLGDHTVGKLYGANRNQPCIVLGAGPSLKHNLDALKQNQEMDHPIRVVSCLHNYGLLEDEGIKADYYLTLDSGGIVVEDVSENRQHEPEWYWEKTKEHKLIAYAASPPKVWDLWKGEVYLYNCLIPDDSFRKEIDDVERFGHYLSTGGNALGGSVYFAKAILCSDPIMFVGADFCFEYDNTFHSYPTHYDTPGNVVHAVDVYGNIRKTWPSYFNFKCFFDDMVTRVPGNWINCSDGILGAYREGNIANFQYMTLNDAIVTYKVTQRAKYQLNGELHNVNWSQIFSDPSVKDNVVLY